MTLRAPLGRRAAPVIAMAAGGAVTLIGSFLPWVRTGSRTRNSYDVFRVVGSLGFAPDGPVEVAMRWWPLVPLAIVLATVAAWWGWARWGGAIGVGAAIYAGVVGGAVAAAPDNDLVAPGAGALITAVGALVLLGGAVAVIVVAWQPINRPTDPGGSVRP